MINSLFDFTMEPGGIVPLIIAPAPITDPAPIFVPLNIVTLAPIQHLSSIVIGAVLN